MATLPPAPHPPGDPPDSAMQPPSQPEDPQPAPRTRHQAILAAWASCGIVGLDARTYDVWIMTQLRSEGVESARMALDQCVRHAHSDPARREAVKEAYASVLVDRHGDFDYSSEPGSSPRQRKRRCRRGGKGRSARSGGESDASYGPPRAPPTSSAAAVPTYLADPTRPLQEESSDESLDEPPNPRDRLRSLNAFLRAQRRAHRKHPGPAAPPPDVCLPLPRGLKGLRKALSRHASGPAGGPRSRSSRSSRSNRPPTAPAPTTAPLQGGQHSGAAAVATAGSTTGQGPAAAAARQANTAGAGSGPAETSNDNDEDADMDGEGDGDEDDDSRGCPLPAAALRRLADWDIDELMQAQIPTINKWAARREFAIRAARANTAIRCANEDLRKAAYQLLCVLPTLLLFPLKRGGQHSGVGRIWRKRFQLFDSGNWETLRDCALDWRRRAHPVDRPPAAPPAKRARRLAANGELTRAAAALDSSPLAPDNDNTLALLRDLHPPGQPLDTSRVPPPGG